jgi:hypothetical protein
VVVLVQAHQGIECVNLTAIPFHLLVERPFAADAERVDETIARLWRHFWINANGFLSSHSWIENF